MGTIQTTPTEIKEQIMERVKKDGVSVAQAARDAGVPVKRVYNWLDRHVNRTGSGRIIQRQAREIEGLYVMIGKLTTELVQVKKKATDRTQYAS